jgi:formylglycine-generating enzyme required for sulfatase activity
MNPREVLSGRYEVRGPADDGTARFRGVELATGRPVLLRALPLDGRAMIAVQSASRALAGVPRVATPLEVFHDPRHGVVIVSTPSDGQTLRKRLDHEGPLAAGTLAKLVEQIGDVLEEAHARGVAHGAITSEVLVLGRGDLLLEVLDFGVGASSSGGARSEADVDALARVSFEALTGATWTGPQSTRAMGKLLPAGFDAWMERCMGPGAPHAGDAARELARLLPKTSAAPGTSLGGKVQTRLFGAEPELPVSSSQVAEPIALPRKKSPLPVIAALAVVLAAGGGFAAWRLSRSAAPPPPPPSAQATATAPVAMINEWITIPPPGDAGALLLGLPTEDPNPDVLGYRPSMNEKPPAHAFQIQQHEVTWGEIEPWLTSSGPMPAWAQAAGKDMPVTGIPWDAARRYCASDHVKGRLPSEQEWEWAARAPSHALRLWNEKGIDVGQLNAVEGPSGKVEPASSRIYRDRTPLGVQDMVGNAQEWTASRYYEDFGGADNAWTVDFKSVRGLPLTATGPDDKKWTLAHREPVCAMRGCDPTHPTEEIPRIVRVRVTTPDPDAGKSVPPVLRADPGRFVECLNEAKSVKIEITGERKGGYEDDSGNWIPLSSTVKVTKGLEAKGADCVWKKLEPSLLADAGGDAKWSATVQLSLAGGAPDLRHIGFRCARDVPAQGR